MEIKEEYKPFGTGWELEMLKFKKQELVGMLRGTMEKNLEKSLAEELGLKEKFSIFWDSLEVVNYYSFDEVWQWIEKNFIPLDAEVSKESKKLDEIIKLLKMIERRLNPNGAM